MAKFINLTPHSINLKVGAYMQEIPSSGIARAAQEQQTVGTIDGVNIVAMTYGNVEGLPDPQEDTYYIVSALTAEAAKRSGRTTEDLLLTADLLRDEQGRIIGCCALATVS